MKWPETEFQDLYEIPSKNGLTRPARVRGSGYKMINMGELFAHDRIGNIEMELVPMSEKERGSMLVEKGDLLFARQSLVLAGAGKCSIVKEAEEPTTFESHIIRIRLRKETANPDFYYYYFKSPQCGIKAIVTQGVQAGIRGNDLKLLPVHVPPLMEQQKIAEILTAYDRLIENNRRRVTLLEEVARQLYREWFVRLRFPGHEHTRIIGGVPEGWEKGCVADFFDTGSGGTPSRKNPDFFTGDVRWVKTQELHNCFIVDTDEKITDDALNRSAAKLYPDRSVLVAMYGATIGQAGILAGEASCNQACCAIVSRNERAGYIYAFLFFVESKQEFVGLGMGAAQNNINQQIIRSFPMMLPSHSLMSIFNETLDPVFKQWLNLEQQTRKLCAARDLLLPRLMCGEVVV